MTDAARFATEGLVAVDPIAPLGPPVQFAVPTLILLDPTDKPQLSWLAGHPGALRIRGTPRDHARSRSIRNTLVKNIRVPHWSLSDFIRSL